MKYNHTIVKIYYYYYLVTNVELKKKAQHTHSTTNYHIQFLKVLMIINMSNN